MTQAEQHVRDSILLARTAKTESCSVGDGCDCSICWHIDAAVEALANAQHEIEANT